MKNLLVLFLAMFVLVGCRSKYDVTLSNGMRFTGVSKPKLDKKTGTYRFETFDGQANVVSRQQIRVIEPHQEPYEFKATQKK